MVKLAGWPEAVALLPLEKVDAGGLVDAMPLTEVAFAYDQQNRAALNVRIKALECS